MDVHNVSCLGLCFLVDRLFFFGRLSANIWHFSRNFKSNLQTKTDFFVKDNCRLNPANNAHLQFFLLKLLYFSFILVLLYTKLK